MGIRAVRADAIDHRRYRLGNAIKLRKSLAA